MPHEYGLSFFEAESCFDRFHLLKRSYCAVLEHVFQDKILLYLVEPELAHGDLNLEFSFVIVLEMFNFNANVTFELVRQINSSE